MKPKYKSKPRKPKSVNYPCVICVRIGEGTRSDLEAESLIEDIGISDVARRILEANYKQEDGK